ncbi:hypothetical protein ACFYST_36050 [Kitasatospora sp. NPDC004614]|uniref:hypothetical protein n=1 Tax=unclassified Kitasatospora TaxID=2633591 RepID=UPI0036BD8F50
MSQSGDIFHPPVVVRPPTRGARPYRRVEIYGRTVGRATSAEDVAEFIRRAGVDEPDLDDPELVAWRGGDHTVWSQPEQPAQPEQPSQPAQPERPERPEQAQQPEPPEPPQKPERPEDAPS